MHHKRSHSSGIHYLVRDSSGKDSSVIHSSGRYSSGSFDIRDKLHNRSSSLSSILDEVIDGVNYFYSHTKHTTGICGQLSLNGLKLTFSNYTSHQIDDNSNSKTNSLLNFIPFNDKNSSNIEIDLLNIGDTKESFDENFILLTIYCANFRCVKFQMKNCDKSKKLIEKLGLLTVNGIINGKYSKLTKSLKDNYSYFLKADWDLFESHWWQCYKLRLTQANENFQLCDSMPPSFVVPKSLSDSLLIGAISTQTRGHRVPIVSFLYPINGNMLIRSSAFDNYIDLNALINNSVTPLRQINIEAILSPIIVVEQTYEKLRDVCYQNETSDDSNNCLSKIGKWITCVNTTLKLVVQIVEILTREASVGIVEETDKHWNCVISSLVQLIIDPKRRTFIGFESLLSKEWIHISGYAYRKNGPHNPNHILFTLFLDCIWQLMRQNSDAFQFSSFYLIWLFDCQYMQFPFIPYTRKSSDGVLELDFSSPPIADGLSLNQLMLINNPFYDKKRSTFLELNPHISQTQFWSPLYLRWHSKSNFERYTPQEIVYLNELQSRNQL